MAYDPNRQTGDLLPPCPKCGRIDKYNVNEHTHDLDHIFGFGDDEDE